MNNNNTTEEICTSDSQAIYVGATFKAIEQIDFWRVEYSGFTIPAILRNNVNCNLAFPYKADLDNKMGNTSYDDLKSQIDSDEYYCNPTIMLLMEL